MTKKHFQAVAAIVSELANASDPTRRATAEWFAKRLADVFHADNARFDKARFLVACGLNAAMSRDWEDSCRGRGIRPSGWYADAIDALRGQLL